MENDILSTVLNNRIEAIKKDIVSYTKLELDSKTINDKIYYAYMVAESKQTLKTVKNAIKFINITSELFK
ncbi:hypothetical protein FDB55_13040 [Clostridium botulinum]|nr:hypothetical protein [Clostridium botulinum]NFN14889.1 hypothetical protein [Clostridium botulinum]NFN22659.1 hypothetical protein [Clostridium botulinum]NFN43333.1 hypothetical protein [Clostridium botulinum]